MRLSNGPTCITNATALLKKGIEERLANGDDVLLEIDYQGALQVRDAFPQAVLILSLPPAGKNCAQCLENRGEDAPGGD